MIGKDERDVDVDDAARLQDPIDLAYDLLRISHMLQYADCRHEVDAIPWDHMQVMCVGDEIHPRARLYIDTYDLGIGWRGAEGIATLDLLGADVEDHRAVREKVVGVRSYLPIQVVSRRGTW
jgi:hypothetical protein